MAKIVMNPITGVKHLPGSALCSFVTACGTVDCFEDHNGHGTEGVYMAGTPDCSGCIDVAMGIHSSISRKELNKLKKYNY